MGSNPTPAAWLGRNGLLAGESCSSRCLSPASSFSAQVRLSPPETGAHWRATGAQEKTRAIFRRMFLQWTTPEGFRALTYVCGFCDRTVAAATGYTAVEPEYGDVAHMAICPNCTLPTFLHGDRQIPGVRFGKNVQHLPDDVGTLYDQARDAIAVGAYTAAVLVGRKLLMSIAVSQGATAGETFAAYVEFLTNNGVVTSAMKEWVDEIRELGEPRNRTYGSR